VPATTIAYSLPYINWVVLVSLALGSQAAVVVGRLAAPATRGYLAFICFCAAAFAGLAWLADGALPQPIGLAIVASPSLDGPRRALLGLFFLVALVELAATLAGRRAAWLSVAGLLVGSGAALVAAIGWTGSLGDGIPAAVELLALAAATGGTLSAMILGHWYLVTPHLSERPMVVGARLLTVVVAIQVLLFVVWSASGVGTGRPFGALVGSSAVFVWLRLLVGLLFPLVLSWMAWRTARSRSMESTTGLLYLDLAAVAAGTIVAAGLWFGPGLLV
jgi:hypothetical protein